MSDASAAPANSARRGSETGATSSSRGPDRARQIVDVTLGRDETRGFAETRAVAREDTRDAIARGVIKPERVPDARRRGLARHSARRCGDRAAGARVVM